MAAWGLNVLRFVPPGAGWTLWALSALALVPPVARFLAPSLARIGATFERGAWGYVPWVLAPMALAWALPDRLMFAGDFLLRETSGQEAHSIFRTLYPQGLPLDQLLHDQLVRGLAPPLGTDVHGASGVLGALEAGVLGALAFRLTRVLELTGL